MSHLPEGGFPGGRRFAFTILDDTDDATVENVKPVYDLLHELGMRTTKTAWPLDCPPEEQGPFFAAETLQDPEYRSFVTRLVERGFELAFHNATMGSSRRDRTAEGLRTLERHFGRLPRLHCNHGSNRENLYWGAERYRSPLVRPVARVARAAAGGEWFEGEEPGSPYFWGDIARDTFDYVRSFAFEVVNTDELPPGRPYRDPTTPYVDTWFVTSDAADVRAFHRLFTPRAVERLASDGGYCILSTHLGKGFADGSGVDGRVEDTLRDLAGRDGWFVPVSELLDYLVATRGRAAIGPWERLRLESAHVLDRAFRSLRNRFAM